MSDALTFDLGIGLDKAKADFRSMVGDMRKQLESLEFNPKSKSSRSGGSSGKSDLHKEIDADIEKEARAYKKQQDMLKDSLNQLVLIETQMGRKLIDQRRETAQALRDLANDPAFDPNQFRRDSNRLLTNYRSDLTTDAAYDRDSMTRRNAELRNEQSSADRLYEIRANAAYRIEQIEQSSGSRLTSERLQLENRIDRIVTAGANKRISDTTRAVNAEIAQFQRLSRANGGGATGGKNLQYIFQAQQMVEDYSFAGFRGASNNIALMASQLGGPTGLIALLGITAVQAYSMGDAFNKTADITDSIRLATERYKAELTALTEVKYTDAGDYAKTADDVERLSRATDRAAGSHRALIETGNKRQDMAAALEQFKRHADIYSARNNFGGGYGAAAEQDALQQMEVIRERLKTMVPEFNWDNILNQKSFTDIDAIVKDVKNGTAEWVASIIKSGDATRRAFAEWIEGAERLKKVREFEKENGLRPDESFKAFSTAESSADKTAIRKLESDVRYWEKMANEARNKLDGDLFAEAKKNAQDAANELQNMKDVVDAVKKAEREQLDQARDALKVQKDKNREKEQELSTAEQLLKSIEKEARSQRIDSASGDVDTRQGMSQNALDRMRARDEKIIGMSPNQDWQKMMTHQMNQYYDAMQARQDRYFAREKEQQLQMKAQSAEMADPKEHRSYLEELQKHQQNQAMNARTPQEANMWYQKSLQTQKLIEESFAKQKEQQQQKIAGIKEEIKSVEELEQRVEQLSDDLRGMPKLNLQDQATLDYLSQVKKEIRDIINLQQQAKQAGGAGGAGGLAGGGGGFGVGGMPGGNPFAGLGDLFASGWGGGVMIGDAGNPFGSVDWGSPQFGGGDMPVASTPLGGWGGAMNAGFQMPPAFQGSGLPTSGVMGGASSSFTQNTSIGNMPIYVSGGNFDTKQIAESARSAANNNLLRRGL